MKYPVVHGVLGVALLLVSYSCSRQAGNVSLPFETPASFSQTGTAVIPQQWWKAFDDEDLNRVVDSALVSNFDLKSAWSRLEAAQAVVRRESASFFPYVDAGLEGSFDESGFFESQDENLNLGLSSSYEVDLWGKIRSRVEAQKYQAEATRSDYRAAAVSLSAAVTLACYRLTEARNQLDLVNEQMRTNEKALQLIRSRFGNGQVRSADILRQEQLLESTREQKSYAESRVQVLQHRLRELVGLQPRTDELYARNDLPEVPPLPATGIPLELVNRRPDVQSAFNSLMAADREMAAAVSNRYPRLQLTASLSTAANRPDRLFREWAARMGGNLLAPLFYGGELRAEVDRTRAVKNRYLYAYAQSVLTAFREVENALIREEKQRQSIQSLEKQLELSQQSYKQLRIQYFNGMGDYLDVLLALDETHQVRRNLLSARIRLIEYRIALYRALAGGFESSGNPASQNPIE